MIATLLCVSSRSPPIARHRAQRERGYSQPCAERTRLDAWAYLAPTWHVPGTAETVSARASVTGSHLRLQNRRCAATGQVPGTWHVPGTAVCASGRVPIRRAGVGCGRAPTGRL